MDESNGKLADQRSTAIPKSLRVIGWLTLVLGAWSLWDDLLLVLDGRRMPMGYVVLAIGSIAGAIGLLRQLRWGYLLTLGYWLLAVAQAAWFFFLEGDFELVGRMTGIPVMLMLAIPATFLLTPKARRWFMGAAARQVGRR